MRPRRRRDPATSASANQAPPTPGHPTRPAASASPRHSTRRDFVPSQVTSETRTRRPTTRRCCPSARGDPSAPVSSTFAAERLGPATDPTRAPARTSAVATRRQPNRARLTRPRPQRPNQPQTNLKRARPVHPSLMSSMSRDLADATSTCVSPVRPQRLRRPRQPQRVECDRRDPAQPGRAPRRTATRPLPKLRPTLTCPASSSPTGHQRRRRPTEPAQPSSP